jgi:hypothetical protein
MLTYLSTLRFGARKPNVFATPQRFSERIKRALEQKRKGALPAACSLLARLRIAFFVIPA